MSVGIKLALGSQKLSEVLFFPGSNEKSLIGLLEASEKLEVVDVWDTRDLRPGRETERWINALARRIE